jgi:CheY-like chemotaxis protein
MHGGVVDAQSMGPGQGSEFVVRLPALPPEFRPLANGVSLTAGPTAAESSGRRVLAVDDNVDVVESLALLLGMQGHDVRTAHDGLNALEQAEAFRPEVIILDIGLPGMDGYEVARRLRERVASQGVLLVALTGYGRDEDRRRSLAAGFDRHLVKPVDPTDLRDLLALSV